MRYPRREGETIMVHGFVAREVMSTIGLEVSRWERRRVAAERDGDAEEATRAEGAAAALRQLAARLSTPKQRKSRDGKRHRSPAWLVEQAIERAGSDDLADVCAALEDIAIEHADKEQWDEWLSECGIETTADVARLLTVRRLMSA